MGELHTGPMHPLKGADPESYIDLHILPPECLQKGVGDCRYLEQHNQAYSGWWGSLALFGFPPRRGEF